MPHTALNVRNDPPVRQTLPAPRGRAAVHNDLTCTPLSVPHMVPAGHAVRWSLDDLFKEARMPVTK